MGLSCFRSVIPGGYDDTTAVDVGVSSEDIQNFVQKIRPLDLLVFRGGEGVSDIIRRCEKFETGNDTISHVEVAINSDWCHDIKYEKESMLSWGSTLSGPLNDGVTSAETHGTVFGVQLRELEQLIASYLSDPRANVGVCRLIHNPIELLPGEQLDDYCTRCEKLREDLSYVYKHYNGNTYNANPVKLLRAMFPWSRSDNVSLDKTSLDKTSLDKTLLADIVTPTNDRWLFCSEFAALLYKTIGVINDATDGVIDGVVLNESYVLPVDFIGADEDEDGIVVRICEDPIWIK